MLGDYGSVGKRCMLDPSVRVPLLVRWPKNFAANQQCDTPVSLLDLWPTFLSAAGQIDAASQGYGSDLKAIAAGEEADRMVISQFQQKDLGLYMWVNRNLKYVYSTYDRREWLLDVGGAGMDMKERDVTDDPDYAESLAALRRALLVALDREGVHAGVEPGRWKN
jgi:choline-sulfatase